MLAPLPPHHAAHPSTTQPNPAMKPPTRPRLRLLTLASALCGLSAAAAPSAPADTDQTVQLDPFVVTADSQTEYGVTSLQGATVLNTPIREIPQSVSVLTKDFLAALGAENMQDAMIWVSGVSPRQNVEDGTVIRSFLTTRTYNDGVRNFDGNYQSDLADFDGIEIIKGPAAAIIGTGEPGGYVDRITKKPQDVDQGYLSVQTGSWAFYRAEFDQTGPINPAEGIDYRTVFAYQHNNTDVVGQHQGRTVFDPSVSWKPYAGTSVLIQYEYQDAHDPWNFGQPFYSVGTGGTATAPKDADFNFFPRDIYQGQTFSGLNNLVQNLRATVTQKINRILEARLIANNFVGNVNGSRTIMGAQTVNATTHDVQETQSYATFTGYIKTFNTQADLVATYDFGPFHNTTLVGAEYIWNSDHEDDFTGVLPNFDVQNPVNNLPVPTTLTQSENQLQQTNQEGYFAQQQTKLFGDRLVLTAGIRYDRAWITTWNYLVATNAFSRTTQAQENWVNAPRVGATFALTKQLSAYGIWSQAESPAAQERAFPNSATDFTILTAETVARLNEVGFKGDFFGGKFTASAAYFDQSQIGFFESTVTSQGVTENIIVPGALVRGLEVDTVAGLAKGFWIISSYTHDFQYYNAATGVPTSVVPKDKFTTYATYQLTKKLSINAGGIYIGPQYSVNGAQIYSRGGQSEFNAGLRYNFSPQWSAGLLVQNLTNKLFVTALVSTTSNWVAPDRNWKLSVKHSW